MHGQLGVQEPFAGAGGDGSCKETVATAWQPRFLKCILPGAQKWMSGLLSLAIMEGPFLALHRLVLSRRDLQTFPFLAALFHLREANVLLWTSFDANDNSDVVCSRRWRFATQTKTFSLDDANEGLWVFPRVFCE